MAKKHYGTILGLTILAGLAGGVIVRQLFASTSAFAQKLCPQAAVIQAKRFELLDENGQRRAVLGFADDRAPALALFDKEGHLRAELGLRPDGGPKVLFWDGKTKVPRVGLALLPTGSPSLELADQAGNLRIVFGLGTNGEPVLGLFDQDENLHTTLDVETRREANPAALRQGWR